MVSPCDGIMAIAFVAIWLAWLIGNYVHKDDVPISDEEFKAYLENRFER